MFSIDETTCIGRGQLVFVTYERVFFRGNSAKPWIFLIFLKTTEIIIIVINVRIVTVTIYSLV